MKYGNAIGRFLLVAAGGSLVPLLPVLAQDANASALIAAGPDAPFDWMHHTQDTLNELRGKLNLVPAQMPAWETWSTGILGDARTQLARKTHGSAKEMHATAAPDAQTTPERMAQGIERLRAQTIWMQAHLVRLEAAQVRTRTFYDTLDTNQKTIFDLFWHEIHHRAFGHDDDADIRRGSDEGPMTDTRDGPPGAY
jgi:hypothetical protein